ncbi:hypothetical protein HK102_009395, partial [Quaeritorhiza haematococci]
SSSDKSNDDDGEGEGGNLAREKAGSATSAKVGSAAHGRVDSLPQGDTVLLALRNILKGQNWGRTQGLIIKHPPDAYRDGDFIYKYLDYLEAYRRRMFVHDATLPGWKDRFAKALVASIPVDGRQAESLIVVVRMLDPDTVTWEEFSRCLTKTFGSGTSRTKAYRKAFDDGKWVQRQRSAITTFNVGLKYAQLSYPKLSWKKQVDKVIGRFAESAPAGTFWTALAAILTQVGPNETIHQVRKQLKVLGLKEDVTVGQLQDKFGDDRRKGPSKPRDVAPVQLTAPPTTSPTSTPPPQPANTISTTDFLSAIGHLGQQIGQQLGSALGAQQTPHANPQPGPLAPPAADPRRRPWRDLLLEPEAHTMGGQMFCRRCRLVGHFRKDCKHLSRPDTPYVPSAVPNDKFFGRSICNSCGRLHETDISCHDSRQWTPKPTAPRRNDTGPTGGNAFPLGKRPREEEADKSVPAKKFLNDLLGNSQARDQ